MDRTEAGRIFCEFLAGLAHGTDTRIHIFTDADADGLPAAALLVRALQAAGYLGVTAETRRKFENAWMPEVHARLAEREPQALLLVDLGTRPDPVLPGVPTLLIDHHAPFGTPPGAVLLTSYGTEPTATSGLLALWCAQAIAPAAADDLQWMAGVSLLSDLGDKAPFAELEESKKTVRDDSTERPDRAAERAAAQHRGRRHRRAGPAAAGGNSEAGADVGRRGTG